MNYEQLVETLIGIFTADKGVVKILLMHKKDEPYKGYWILPGELLNDKETLEDNITDVVCDKLGLPTMYIEQFHSFSNLNRNHEKRAIATTFIGLINNIILTLRKQERENLELAWFDINSIPKMGYDHDKIVEKLINYLKKRIIDSNILKILFPSDFTIPELQKVYEQLLDIQIDRRNFRKRILNSGYIVSTGDVNEGNMGRPAKLYRFNDNKEEGNIF